MFKSLLFSSLLFSPLALADTFIQLNSDQGDWIGQGQVTRLDNNLPFSASDSSLWISHESGFSFTFQPANGQKLQTGVFSGAMRAPFRSGTAPGLEVSGPGRGCNQISGEFVIYEYDLSANPHKIALDFVQYCDSTSKKLTGSIRLNSALPDPYPFPVAVIKTSQVKVKEGSTVQIQGQSSFSKPGRITNYSWSQIEGKQVTLEDTTTAELKLTTPTDVALGGEKTKLRLTVTDNLGQQDTEDFVLTTSSKSDPQSYYRFESAAGDFIGGGRTESFDDNNAIFNLNSNYDKGVSVSVTTRSYWNLDFAAPNNEALSVGEYHYAERFPFQSAGVAGLSITGEHRGCNRSFGNFKVHQLQMDNNNKSFKASFEQRCESTSAPLLKGEIAVNAVHESVPKASAGADIEVSENALVNLNGSDSVDLLGSLVIYQWSIDDATVQLEGADKSRANFKAPALPDRVFSKTYQAKLVVVDNEGYKAQDNVKITVLANNKAPVAADDSFELEIGKSLSLNLQKNDSDSDGRLASDSIELVKQPQSGTVKINTDGTVLYSHTGTAAGSDNFSYRIKDNDGVWSNEAAVSLSIKEKVTPPVPVEKPAENKGSSGGSWSFTGFFALALTLWTRNRSQRRSTGR
ncbi:Ig-like domain-containing protein [Rheinheimera sp.]|uniref:PKD domain-containing protein n=1 Tax=Rheinheimera sp. TaxID=1869214 RepID=UPI0027BA406D|nr:Ig-like domain-containing protein [Rheinheimera sp.]